LEHEIATNYLKSRKLSEEEIEFWDFRYDEKNERVVFPVRTLGLNGAVGRSVHEKKHYNYFGMYTADCLGGYDKLTNAEKIIVVEGVYDMTRLRPFSLNYGFNCVCSFTSQVSDFQLELIDNLDTKLYCGFDCDEAGQRGYKSMKKRHKVAGRFKWTGVKDWNDMTDEQLNTVLNASR
jgi:DNA primase